MTNTQAAARTSSQQSRALAAFKAHSTMTARKLADTPKTDSETIASLIDKLVDLEVGALQLFN